MWTKIKDFPNYEAHPDGLVRSLGKRGKAGVVLKPQVNKKRGGYLYVNLRNETKAQRKALHRIIAETFIPNPNNLPTVNHKLGDKTKCAVGDLEWATYKENNEHALRTGLRQPTGLTPIVQYKDNTIIKEYNSITEAVNELGIARQLISNVLRGKKKTTHGFIFKYREDVNNSCQKTLVDAPDVEH